MAKIPAGAAACFNNCGNQWHWNGTTCPASGANVGWGSAGISFDPTGAPVTTIAAHQLQHNLDIDTETLSQWAASSNPVTRVAAAMHPNTTADTLAALAGDNEVEVLHWVLTNDNTPTGALKKITNDLLAEFEIEDIDETVCWAASNKNADRELLDQLRSYDDNLILSHIAGNDATPADMMEQLADDESEHVRAAAAVSGKISDATRERLANDWDPYVRANLASSAFVSDAVLATLANDEDEEVQEAAAETIAKRASSS